MRGIDVAFKMHGFQEVRDNKHLRVFFQKYAIKKDLDIDPAKISWCAAFINACERAIGNSGTGKLTARSFLTYGKKVLLQDARQGDICIFARGNSKWQGHVTYFVSFYGAYLVCFGGNQTDAVGYQIRTRAGFLGIVRPPVPPINKIVIGS